MPGKTFNIHEYVEALVDCPDRQLSNRFNIGNNYRIRLGCSVDECAEFLSQKYTTKRRPKSDEEIESWARERLDQGADQFLNQLMEVERDLGDMTYTEIIHLAKEYDITCSGDEAMDLADYGSLHRQDLSRTYSFKTVDESTFFSVQRLRDQEEVFGTIIYLHLNDIPVFRLSEEEAEKWIQKITSPESWRTRANLIIDVATFAQDGNISAHFSDPDKQFVVEYKLP